MPAQKRTQRKIYLWTGLSIAYLLLLVVIWQVGTAVKESKIGHIELDDQTTGKQHTPVPSAKSVTSQSPKTAEIPKNTQLPQTMLTPARSMEEGLIRIKELVKKFDQGKDRYLKAGFRESQVRQEFLNPMLAALGWDATNSNRSNLFDQDTVPEMRMQIADRMKYLDYGQRINGRHAFSLEAKAAHHDIDEQSYQWQAHRYAWSSMRSELSILTNFSQFRVYDSRLKPDWNNPAQGEIKDFTMSYMEYPKHWQLLWDTFSKEKVTEGSIKMLLNKLDKSLERIPPDKALIGEVDQLRLELAKDIYANNKDIDPDMLNEATHHFINKVLFTRILEDRDIETTGVLRMRILHWKGDPVIWADKEEKRQDNRPLQQVLQDEFTRLKKRYNGVVFGEHPSDKLKISDTMLEKVIMSLYPEGCCPYDFSVIDPSLLGKVHENYLGKRIVINKGEISLEEKPEVREAGGVFYTKPVIAQYIVRRVLMDKAKGKTPKELCNIKLIDPACGCGAFLMEATRFVFNYCRDYYRQHPEAITGKDTEFPDAEILADGSIKLSPLLKAELVKNIIHGVDIDPQAIEISTMWLYTLILEKEGSSIVDKERSFKIPNRSWDSSRTTQSFKLPDLGKNLVCGNALVEPDFAKITTDKSIIEKAQPFDWKHNGTNIEKVMIAGGFDAVVGNPPYLSSSSMVKMLPVQKEYLNRKYHSMSDGRADISFGFVERGSEILNSTGKLGYILTNRIIYNEAAAPLRKYLKEKSLLKGVVNFSRINLFDDAFVFCAILFADKGHSPIFSYYKLKGSVLPSNFNSLTSIEEEYETDCAYHSLIPTNDLKADLWILPSPRNKVICKKVGVERNRLSDVCTVLSGSSTGKDSVYVVKVLEDRGQTSLVSSGENNSFEIESAILRPIARSRNVQRYCPLNSKQMVIWPYENGSLLDEMKLRERFPKVYSYLLSHKAALKKRSSIQVWYQIQRPGNEANFLNTPKLVTKVGNANPVIGIDPEGDDLRLGGGMWSALIVNDKRYSPEMILGILNSDTIHSYVSSFSPEYAGGYKYSANILQNISIPEITAETASLYKKIEDKVKKIIALKTADPNNNTSTMEGEIDRLVREIYGIPAENAQPQQQLPDAEELKPAAHMWRKYQRKPVSVQSRSEYNSKPLEDEVCSCLSSMMVA